MKKRTTRSSSAKIAAVVCAVVLAMGAAGAAWLASTGDPATGGNFNSSTMGTSMEAAVEEDGASTLRLSSWDRFGEFWEGCAEGEAAYSEAEPGGAARCYRLREGYEPGPGVDERSHAALLGAERVGLSSEGAARWDLAAVDCSTGEVSWWAMSSEVAARLSDPDADLGVLREQGVVPLDGRRWVVYADEPQEVDEEETSLMMRVYTGEEAYRREVDMFESLDDLGKLCTTRVALRDEKLMRMLIDEYGEETMDEWIALASDGVDDLGE